MTQEEQRKKAVEHIIGLIENNPFTFEFKVMKRPKGIRVIYEITQEEMDALIDRQDI